MFVYHLNVEFPCLNVYFENKDDLVSDEECKVYLCFR